MSRNFQGSKPFTTTSGIRWLPWQNTSATECPAFGVFQCIGTVNVGVDRVVFRGTQFSTGTNRIFAVNGPTAVAAGAYGKCTFDSPCIAAYNLTGADPVQVNMWGPQAGSWLLERDQNGFINMTGVDTTAGWGMWHRHYVTGFAGVAAGAIASGATGPVSGCPGTSANLTVFNAGQNTIPNNDKIVVSWIDYKWAAQKSGA